MMILNMFKSQKTLSSKVAHYPQINLCTQFDPIKMTAGYYYFFKQLQGNYEVDMEMV